MSYSLIFITCPSQKEAERIANSLLEERLIACANIIPKIKSIYWWHGKIEQSRELLLILKTRNTLLNKIVDKVKEIHSYSVPEIISIAITRGNKDYLAWINHSVKKVK